MFNILNSTLLDKDKNLLFENEYTKNCPINDLKREIPKSYILLTWMKKNRLKK